MSYKTDLRDRKLLYELDIDSRQSYKALAKKLKISENAIIYRIKELQKEGVIKGFHAIIDTGKLGYLAIHIYSNLENTTPEKEKEIVEFLKKQEIITWLTSVEGNYNLSATILTKSLADVNNLWRETMKKYINYFDKRLMTITTRLSFYGRAYLLDSPKNRFSRDLITEPKNDYDPKIDKKDMEILKILAENARAKIIDIAEKVKLTPKTIISRIKTLENKKIIVGYTSFFDLTKIGYHRYKMNLLLSNLTKGKEEEFHLFVNEHPNIIFDHFVIGGDDLEIELEVKNHDELRKIIDELREKFSDIIKDHSVMQYYQEHKNVFFPIKHFNSL